MFRTFHAKYVYRGKKLFLLDSCRTRTATECLLRGLHPQGPRHFYRKKFGQQEVADPDTIKILNSDYRNWIRHPKSSKFEKNDEKRKKKRFKRKKIFQQF